MNIFKSMYVSPKYLPHFFLIWALLLLTIYFFWFPLPQPNAENPYPAFALSFWTILVIIASGNAILELFRITFRHWMEKFIFSAGLGFVLLAYLTLGLGFAHGLYSKMAYVVLFTFTLVFSKNIVSLLRNFLSHAMQPRQFSLNEVLWIALILFLLIFHFLGTLVPPIFFDSLVYHLAIPKLYILHHKIFYYPYNFFSNFPFTIEMLYTFGLLLQSSIVVKCLNYALHLLMLASFYAFARRYFLRRTALIGVLIFYSITWVGLTSFLLYIDLGLACYFWLAAYTFFIWVERKELGWLILSGIFTGVMLGIKYLAVYGTFILILNLLAFLIWQSFSARRSPDNIPARSWYHYVCFFGLPAALIASPWYIKNFIFTGNPIYPFIFGGRDWDLVMVQSYMDKFHDNLESIWEFFRLPWTLIFDKPISLSPVFLIFLPVLFFVKQIPLLIKVLLFNSFIFILLWANGSQQTRFLIPIFPFMSLCTAYAISEGIKFHVVKKFAYGVLILLCSSSICFELIYIDAIFSPFSVIMGTESRHEYLERKLPTLYPITQYANEHLPSEAVILYIGDTRGYYSDRPFIANTAHDRTVIVELAHQAIDAADLRQKLTELGVTHIIFNKREGSRLHSQYRYLQWKTAEDAKKFVNFTQSHLKLLHAINESELLEIIP